ncbi:MAG: methyltransferase domain-containing protein [Candidatus Nitrosotenuis sp.]
MSARLKEIFYPESKFGGFTDSDGTITFYNRVHALTQSTSVIVDFGCGRGLSSEDTVPYRSQIQSFKGKVRKVIGLDIDRASSHNPKIDEFYLLTNDKWPLGDNSADLCVSDSVIEHLRNPERFFSECRRVLKNDGYLCLKTSNVMSYVGLLSMIIPNKFHASILKKVQENRKSMDVFPTYYRCNTISRVKRMFEKYGFEHVVYGYEAEPTYLDFSRLAYWMGTLHQRLAPSFLRQVIFGFGKLHKQQS